MKLQLPAYFLFTLLLSPLLILAQSNCKVLLPEIDSIYDGKCKKGLANGEGIAIGKDTYQGKFKKGWPDGFGVYTWSTGEVYEGDFVEGVKDGEGVYRFFTNNRDTALVGLWKDDVYIGPKPMKPKVMQSVAIDRHTFRKNSDVQNRVLIDFRQNGGQNPNISGLLITADSGYEFSLGNTHGFKDMTFPVTMLVKYTTPNKLQTRQVYCIFEFVIYEPGDWAVDLFN
ncbi:MAG: hypothetical protein K9H16_11790 [Bacteroidales bacterium]|nr:hypothetical protein [Bacteroidales bacterium]